MGKPLHWIVVLQLSSAFAYTYEPWYRGDTRRPVDLITDVINDLGVKILQRYSSHGNVAFSPTGVAFVLAALYEGSAGRGSQQIVDAMGLPADRDVTRIGFRDIHRRLRSYLNADGFLGGLTLSRENTRLRPEYEDILRFYGFDLSSIEQEANVTVSVEDRSTTTELPAETTSAGSATDTTTSAVTGAVATLSSSVAAAETTLAPSTAAATVANVPTTPPPGAPIASSPTAVVPDEGGAQPPPSAATGSVATPPSMTTTTPLNIGQTSTSMDSQASASTVTMVVVAGSQTPPMPTTVYAGDIATDVPTMSTQAPPASAATTRLMSADTEVPSTFGTSTAESTPVVTNASSSDSSTVETRTEATTAGAGAIVADTTAANATVTGEISDTATSNSSATVTPITPDTASVTIPNPVTGTMMANSIVPQQNAEPTSTSGPAGDTSGVTITTIGLTTASMTDADADGTTAPISPEGSPETTTTMISPVAASNGTLNDLAGNSDNSAIATSTSIGNQTVAPSPTGENTVAMGRRRKSIEVEVTELKSKMEDITSDSTVKDESTRDNRKRRTRSPRGYFSSYPDEGIWMQDLDIWKSYSTMSPRESPEDSTSEITFLVNGCDAYSVSGSRYTAVLPFAYFPSLQAVALEFPLDDPRYNIILLMPTDRTDTHRLARDLSGKSLRLLRKRLQPTWVRATIPSFMLRGFVTLTSFLQRLGILDVFEPRVADLSPMTADLGVYARDVQQSIGVNIRNYMKPDRTHSRNGLFERAGPVPFTAMHPFLYFIVDTETSVSLIAGRVDDPLNSRIL
ncbi:mucin-17 isoform X2 [Harpegnathos saltator]|uniref:mucin-17 isoform X2 n=1 Tax=Harpegnathos saltator TaxID=610380 RepID=UPI000948915E|nr:mucin-17 isoform X2 [Harpegnathos saltator]